MLHGNRWFTQDLTLRASGVLLLVLGALTMRYLFHMAHVPPKHEASAAEMGLAAIGFPSLSGGAALTFLGVHIFDEVEISARWAKRPIQNSQIDVLSREELLARFDLRSPITVELPAAAQAGPVGAVNE